ncbi:MAG: GGDEF domain-containing protein [Rhizobacter sp.]
MSTRVGLGAGAHGMRTWLAGDVVLLTGQACTALDAVPLGQSLQLPQLTLSSGLVTAGIALHLAAIHRHRVPDRWHPMAGWAAAFGIGLAIGTASLVADAPVHRAMLLNLSLVAMLATAILRDLLPQCRFLGVRILMVAMGIALGTNLLMLASAMAQPDVVRDGAVAGLLVNMVMTMVTTSAFVLWLQEELRESLRQTAQTDALTGLLNRHGVMPQLQREIARARRTGEPLSVALCDIDHFKRINDTQGHAAGDAVLASFADGMQTLARGSDLVARWGGEEFLLVLPGTTAQAAQKIIERMAVRLADTEGPLHAVGFSAGVASTAEDGHSASTGSGVDTLLAQADRRLYQAKGTRNTVVAS